MGNRVERVRTEVSEQQMVAAILAAWKDMFDTIPSKEQVSIILAQNSLETGNRKSMWNYNVGNIKANPKGQIDYFYLNAPEQTSKDHWEKLNMAFRAYPTLKDGVKDYLKLLSSSSRYSNAWQHIQNPDPAAFSKALKQGGYYTANEADYTKLISSLYNKYSKSDSYDVANKSAPMDNKPSRDIFQEIATKYKATEPTAPTKVNDVLNKYLQEVIASEKHNKILYKQFLPNQNIVINVKSKNYTDAIEFSRILCAALDEELMATAFIHTDNNNIEVNCIIPGPELKCFETVKQLTASLASVFKNATIKIGGIDINTKCIMNKKSSYQEISLDTALTQYRKFLLQFIKG